MFENKKKIIIILGIVLMLFIVYLIYESINQSSKEIDFNILLDGAENINIENEEELNKSVNFVDNDVVESDETVEIKETIVVHITGEVKNEGVIYLEKGARLVDAIKEAGGETKEADLSQVNLAYELQDGQKIYIPNKNEKISQYIIESGGNNENIDNNNGKEKKVNINTANQNELDSLPGIGPSIAERIIEYRQENGNFSKIEDLQNVKGIGDAKFQDIKEYVTV